MYLSHNNRGIVLANSSRLPRYLLRSRRAYVLFSSLLRESEFPDAISEHAKIELLAISLFVKIVVYLLSPLLSIELESHKHLPDYEP